MVSKSRRGMLLVSVMFFVLVVGMISRAILIAGPGMARIGTQANEELLAQRAAEAGASYARSQLRENSDWKGDNNATTINQSDFKVVEDQGNVIGWMRNAQGEVSMFRIRFNYQDGGSGPDDLPNPGNPNHYVDHPYVSVNNVRSNASAGVPLADPGTWSVTTVPDPNDPASNVAPSLTMVLAVEGIAGRAVSETSGPDSTIANANAVRRMLRVVFAASASPSVPKSAISAGNGLHMEMSSGATVSVVGTDEAKLRSKKEVALTQPSSASDGILTMDGSIGRDAGSGGVNAVINGTITEEQESVGDGNDFHNLPWSEVPLASSNQTEAVQIPGGIYVAKIDGTYEYFDMDAAAYKAAPKGADGTPDTGGVTLDSNWSQVRSAANMSVGGINFDDSTYTLTIDKDVRVNPSSNGNNDIVITNPMGRNIHENDSGGPFEFGPPTFYAAGTLELKNAIISTAEQPGANPGDPPDSGDLAILINVKGDNGSIAVEGEAVVAAPSVTIETGGPSVFQQVLSVYAKGDLTVSTFIDTPGFFAPPYVNIPPYKGYGPLRLEGLIYSWGDADVVAGTPGQAAGPGQYGLPTNYGDVAIQGALVAYGDDPGNFDPLNPATGPGAAGLGRVSVFGEIADIIYDPSKLIANPSGIPPSGPLDGLLRVSYGFEN